MAILSIEVILKEAEFGAPPPEQAGIYGVDFPSSKAQICVLGVPWDATSSYGSGSFRAPEAIRKASHQMDLMDQFFGPTYRYGIQLEILQNIERKNFVARKLVSNVLDAYAAGEQPDPKDLKRVNELSVEVMGEVAGKVKQLLENNKIVGVLGGDHSVSKPIIAALSALQSFGVLHLDAHHDLREAYEGFNDSHASVFYNIMKDDLITKLVSVGLRDFSHAEREFADKDSRISSHYNEELFARKSSGHSWQSICDEIVTQLPEKVYISFDIDGLSPLYCPSTGTPVPGGLTYDEAVYLIHQVVISGRKVIGFDLVEVVPAAAGEWDSNVGARLLYKLCGAAGKSQEKLVY